MKTPSCSILVNSCDKYEDIWLPFFYTLRDRWPNCSFDIVLNTESKSFSFPGLSISTYPTAQDLGAKSWGGRLRLNLKSITSEFVIMLFDDYILEADVNQEKVQSCLGWLQENTDIAVFYFSNIVGENDRDGEFSEFELVPRRHDYRLNSAPAIWRRETLLALTGAKDDPWSWEYFGSARTYRMPSRFYCACLEHEDVFVYNYRLGGAIHRGKWVRSVIEPVLARHKIDLDLSIRGFEDEELLVHKHTLAWQINFVITGFKIIGFDAFIFLFRGLRRRLCRLAGLERV